MLTLLFLANILPAKSQYIAYPVYTGNDLGINYSPRQTSFKIWAPSASSAKLFIYTDPNQTQGKEYLMKKSADGTWTINIPGDQKGKQYTFSVNVKGKWLAEVPDPYVKAVGLNGKRGVVLDPKTISPAGWALEKSPPFRSKTDAIIYELHVRDASINPASGIKQKGKFNGLTELNTKNTEGLSTGLSHIKELGVTHVHLLPFYDINSVDEAAAVPKYNWGYDPLNYNVPEGSYSTNASDPATRIREFKNLVKTFHENGLRVVMDVVYNHTALTENSYFNQLVPGYYYRQTPDGKFSNATACGNETASERPMVRKFILESMKYWVEEYHIDGFRVDLMGVHDIATMNIVSRELHKIKPDILIYGEGWTAGSSPLPDSLRALKQNVKKLDRVAVFSDDIRDGIKGHVFTHDAPGFVSGNADLKESVKFGIVASLPHPQINYAKVNYSKAPYAAQPYQVVTYAECHDNHTLWDKLAIAAKNSTEEDRKRMHMLSLAIVLTSQGISFLHAGTEFLRTKQGVENSFDSPDNINWMDWGLKSKNKDVFEFVKSLIEMRKLHPAFRMRTAEQISSNLRFLDTESGSVISYTINGAAVGDSWKKIFVAFNGSGDEQSLTIPPGQWKSYLEQDKEVTGSLITIGRYSATILYQ